MTKIYSRRDIVEQFVYSEHSDFTPKLMETLVRTFLRWPEHVFMDYINGRGHFTLVRLRKDTYYLR